MGVVDSWIFAAVFHVCSVLRQTSVWVTQSGGCHAGSRGDLSVCHCKVSGRSSCDCMPVLFATEGGVSLSLCSIEKQSRIQERFKK